MLHVITVAAPDPQPDGIRRIRMFLGRLDPDPDPLVQGKNPAPDFSIIKQK
jgi:hypothetical protein